MKRTIIKKLKKAVAVFMAVNMLFTFVGVSSMSYEVMSCSEEYEMLVLSN